MGNISNEFKNKRNGVLVSDQSLGKVYPFPVSCNDLTQRDQRALIFHLLYAMDAFDYQVSLESIAENMSREYGFVILTSDAPFQAAAAVISLCEKLDAEVYPLLENWRFDRLSVATRLIVRYAVWELISTDLPSLVVINEAVELAKCFAEQNAYRFVNGILDEWVKKNKPEMQAVEPVKASE